MRPDSLHEAESRHSLTPQQFRELACGDGSPATLAALSRAEYSHRLLLFDLLMDALSPLAGVTGGSLPPSGPGTCSPRHSARIRQR